MEGEDGPACDDTVATDFRDASCPMYKDSEQDDQVAYQYPVEGLQSCEVRFGKYP